MVAERAAFVLAAAFLAFGSPVVSSEESEVAVEAFAVDDACAAQGDAECELSLRQLRAGQVATEERSATVSKHEQAQAEAALAAPAASTHANAATDSVRANATKAGCTAADQAAMAKLGSGNSRGSFPEISAKCGHSAYSWFSFHSDRMKSCLEEKVGVSASCAACFVKAGQYGVDHCKLQCLFGSWCSHACLNCNSQGEKDAQTCAGVPTPTAAFC
mmetsp:Transcript_86999/g.254585  ORF Transcript_86999/g.254585 Transcript_86999/m.254585 type:complete len:217 (+) Transcript_86999:123-773(+)